MKPQKAIGAQAGLAGPKPRRKSAAKTPAKTTLPKPKPARKKRKGKKPGPKTGKHAARNREKKRALEKAKEAFLPKFDAMLELLSEGMGHRAAMDQLGLAWPEISRQMGADIGLRARYDAAIQLREEFWKAQRLDEMHRRGVEGYDQRVVSAGKDLGTDKAYSDTLLLRAVVKDNPAYADRQKADVTVNSAESLAELVAELEADTPAGSTAPITPPPGLPLPTRKPKAEKAE